MATLSTKFHDVSGHLTKIAVTALGAKDEIQDLDVSKMTSQEMAELVKKMCVVFGKVGEGVRGADETLMSVKNFIYQQINKDTIIPERATDSKPTTGG